MDPGRKAMIYGNRSSAPPTRRDIIPPRRDPNTRITKSSSSRKALPSSSARSAALATAASAKYQTQDEQSVQYVADEDKFVLRQSKKKADIRVRDRRATPIDNLAFHIRFIDPNRDVFDEDDADATIDVPSPESIIQGLDRNALDALDKEITSFHTLEAEETNRDYWMALRTLCRDRRQRLCGQGEERDRAISAVAEDVDKVLGGKTLEELETTEVRVRAKLDSNEEDIDVDYWDQLLKRLLVWKAKARLNKINQSVREARIKVLKLSNPAKAEALENSASTTAASASTSAFSSSSRSRPGARGGAAFGSAKPLAPVPPSAVASSSSSTAPPPGTERFAQTGAEDFSQATKALYEREMARGVSENEEIFMAEEAIPGVPTKPAWADKYRPRKPRYFNRVQMGYEWNKYNQTHYDHDNPPPKVVQGYKFNIFYPDLIDKTKAPTFKIIREGGRRRGEALAPAGQEDTCLIRFTAGPPYEDIAYRIVDREWDYSAKRERGFKSSFDKGILQLHFQFKRIFYRK